MNARPMLCRAAAAGLLLALMAGPTFAADDAQFDLVAVRMASGVAHAMPPTLGPPAAASIRFGQTLEWLDGRKCANWTRQAAPAPLNLDDPMLSDATAPPARDRADHRSKAGARILCDGAAFATFAEIDANIIVVPTPNGAALRVFERRLPAATVAAVQAALTRRGYSPGQTIGAITGEMRQSLAQFARREMGASYIFDGSVLSRNLIDALLEK